MSEEVQQVHTAFLVVQRPDGHWEGLSDIDTPITVERPAGLREMRQGVEEVLFDLGVSVTVNALMGAQMQMARMARDAAEGQKIANKLLVP